MKVTISRPCPDDAKEFGGMQNYVWDHERNEISFHVPDKEGFKFYDPFKKQYYNEEFCNNAQTLFNEETETYHYYKATLGWYERTYEDGSVTKTEPKKIS